MPDPVADHENHIAESAHPQGKSFPGRHLLRRHLDTLQSVAAWTLLTAVSYVIGGLGDLVGAPAPHLVAGLLIGAVAALSGLLRRGMPRPYAKASQAGVGVLMGSYVTPAGLQVAGITALPLLGITALTIVLCIAAGMMLSRAGRISTADGTLGMVPGGSAAIVAAAEELQADGRLVAFTQYLRVALVALTAPVIASALHPHARSESSSSALSTGELTHFVTGAHQLPGALIFVGVCVLGVQTGRRLALPAATLLGPMLLAALVVFTGAAQGFTPAGILHDVLFVGVGLEVGARFTRQSVGHIRRLLPHVLIGTLVVCTACGALAWATASIIGIPVMDAYLATTPGGINAVLAAATATDSDIPIISTVQSARLFIVMLITPPIIRWLTKPRPSVEPTQASPEPAVS